MASDSVLIHAFSERESISPDTESTPATQRYTNHSDDRYLTVTSQHGFQMHAAAYPHCPMCEWRRSRIPDLDPRSGPDTAPPWTCDSEHPAVLKGLHTCPDPLWVEIINTNTLCSPSAIQTRSDGRPWIRIPLRCAQDMDVSDSDYVWEGKNCRYHEKVIAFHNTKLTSLVRSTEYPREWQVSIGSGILNEGRLRYGPQTHKGKHGVNVYADGGVYTFTEPGWVSLEVLCCNTSKLQGGADHRYCVRGQTGQVCRKVALQALWILYSEVPSMIYLS